MALGIHGQDPSPDVDIATLPNEGQQTMANSVSVTIASDQTDVKITLDSEQVDVSDRAARDMGKIDVASLDQYTPVSGRLPVDGSGVTQPISIAATVTTKEVRAASVAQTTVSDTASSTTILASNANRLGATIFNDSSAVLYLKLGATASSTSYSVRMVQYSLYEVPFGYTGVIDGIWASDPNDGAARVTELTA